jgi:very-short-patch-repair endonuclease
VARADLAYPLYKIAVEYDGAWHWMRHRQDERRRQAMRALGWTVLVFDADDVYRRPERIVSEVAAALRSSRRAG